MAKSIKIILFGILSLLSVSLVNAYAASNAAGAIYADYYYFVDSKGLMSLGDGTVGWYYGSFISQYWAAINGDETYLGLNTKNDATAHDYDIFAHVGGDSAYFCQPGSTIVSYYDSSANFQQEYLIYTGETYFTICNGVWSDWYSDEKVITAYPNTQITTTMSQSASSVYAGTDIIQL